MKKLKILLALSLFLLSACETTTQTEGQISYEYDKVHIHGVGCVPRTSCRTIWLRSGYAGTALIEYTDSDGNIFTTSSYALVKGTCPICDNEDA